MIFDSILRLNEYSDFNSELKTVIDFISKNDLLCLPFGKTVLNESVYLNKEEYYGKDEEKQLFENHKHHIDIQIVIIGQELILTSYSPDRVGEYDPERDIVFAEEAKKNNCFHLNQGFFLLLYPGEWHKPCIGIDKGKIIKVVFKIAV